MPVHTGQAVPRSTDHCFACGVAHPHGLHLHFTSAGPLAVEASWVAKPAWESFDGIIHGGIVATLLDEAMSQAISSAGTPAFTCDLRIRLHQHVRPGENLCVRGWVSGHTKRKITTEGSLAGEDGQERAHAWAVFLEVRPGEREAIPS
jgi:acyl-coenzyme A thioesterase PaaI-like protein